MNELAKASVRYGSNLGVKGCGEQVLPTKNFPNFDLWENEDIYLINFTFSSYLV